MIQNLKLKESLLWNTSMAKDCRKKLDNEASSIQGQFTPQEVKVF